MCRDQAGQWDVKSSLKMFLKYELSFCGLLSLQVHAHSYPKM